MSKTSWIGKIVCILFGIVAIGVVIPYVITSSYSGFWTDDFAGALRVIHADGNNILYKSLDRTYQSYLHHQGTYFGTMIWCLTSPLVLGKLALLRVFAPVNMILFVASLYILIESFMNRISSKRYYALIPFSLFIIPLLSFESYQEVFFWHCGMSLFSIPLSVGFLGLAIIIGGDKKWWRILFSSVFIFLAMGGHLMVAVMLAYVIIICFIIEIIRKKITVGEIIFTTSAVIGLLLAVFAPGNFERKGGTEFSIIESALHAWSFFVEKVYNLLGGVSDTMLLFIIISLICGMLVKRRLEMKLLIIVEVLFAFFPAVSIFPAILAMNIKDNSIAETRYLFIFMFAFILSLEIIAFCIGNSIRKIFDKKTNVLIMLICVLTITIVPWTVAITKKMDNIVPLEMVNSLREGQIQECYRNLRIRLREIEETGDEIVELPCPTYPQWADVCTFNINPESYQNSVIATYYGKKMILFYY